MSRCKFIFAILLAASTSLVISTTSATAEVTLPRVICSHMVLQRDMPLSIWGAASPGEKVTVSFRNQQKSAIADPQGKWLVRLEPLEAGGPDAMKIAGKNVIALEDVLVGEVWVGSGQSNMDCPVTEFWKKDTLLAEAAKKSYPRRALGPGRLPLHLCPKAQRPRLRLGL